MLYTNSSLLGLSTVQARELTKSLASGLTKDRTAVLDRSSIDGVLQLAHNHQMTALGSSAIQLQDPNAKSPTRIVCTVYFIEDDEWNRESQLECKIRGKVQKLMQVPRMLNPTQTQ